MYMTSGIRTLLVSTLLVFTFIPTGGAQIFRWDNGEICPGTEGVTPGPGLVLPNYRTVSRNLEYADLSGGLDLSGSDFQSSSFRYAHLMNSNLSHS
jgi:hypothetical protein